MSILLKCFCIRYVDLRCSDLGLMSGKNISIYLISSNVSSGGNCDLTCESSTKCTFSCTSGNCASVTCKADTCEQSCTGGGCGLECHGTTCEQSCTGGNCALQCPSEAETCQQICTINRDRCTIEYIQAPRTECDSVENGICIQSCIGGGCTLKCLKSDEYHSCEQSCTGRF